MDLRLTDRIGVEQRIEGGDPISLGGRDREPFGDVAKGSTADRADGVLDGVESGKQQVPLRTSRRAAEGDVAVETGEPSPFPRRPGRTQEGVNRLALCLRGLFEKGADVQQVVVRASTRTAVALNSAVPDLGSQASMVSAFTSVSSGK